MLTSVWSMMIAVALAGAVGGIINALMTENGFVLPKAESNGSGAKIYRPGFLGNIVIGAISAAISWGLYGPLSAYTLIGSDTAQKSNEALITSGLTLAALVGATLVGIGGAKWLTNEIDKKLLRAAASNAATNSASTDKANKIALASPFEAFQMTGDGS
jgi:hypothetical protein